jgi:type IV secretory pathway TrbL component
MTMKSKFIVLLCLVLTVSFITACATEGERRQVGKGAGVGAAVGAAAGAM